MAALRVLIIDNKDSYTLNLVPLLPNTHTIVLYNDQVSGPTVKSMLPYFDAVILSPGPGRPDLAEDFGVCKEILECAEVPVFGICLGHQGIATTFGGSVQHAKNPIHGTISEMNHFDNSILFQGIPNAFKAVRYNSLVVDPCQLPKCLKVTSICDGEIMGLEHTERPIFGVQFHPDSICSEYGLKMMENFINLVRHRHPSCKGSIALPHDAAALSLLPSPRLLLASPPTPPYIRLHVSKIHSFNTLQVEDVFSTIFDSHPEAVWLDSARTDQEYSRFSIIGIPSSTVQYNVATRIMSVGANGKRAFEVSDFWQRMSQWIMPLKQVEIVYGRNVKQDSAALCFPFRCGFIGYVGYEMSLQSIPLRPADVATSTHQSDAAFAFIDRAIVFDRIQHAAYVISLEGSAPDMLREDGVWDGQSVETCQSWTLSTLNLLSNISYYNEEIQKTTSNWTFQCRNSRDDYVDAIQKCKNLIREGESYELCLTTQFLGTTRDHNKLSPKDILDLFKRLRRKNAAPFSAFLPLGGPGRYILSASPERFMSISNEGVVSMKPIKGTSKRVLVCQCNPQTDRCPMDCVIEADAARVKALSESVKERAELLMIADLIRNDLVRACPPASIHVEKLFAVETYATVHQLVSTINGTLLTGMDSIDALKGAFPPGSMTGAPKLRSVQLLHHLEGEQPRGVYSGVIGYVSVGVQGDRVHPSDWSVVIRTAVVDQKDEETVLSIGAGGAITCLSDASDEWDEMYLKAMGVMSAFTSKD